MKRLWILEDEAELLSVLEVLAKSKGFSVKCCSNTKQAKNLLRRALKEPLFRPDLVISDFHLGEETSESWMLEIRSLLPETEVVCFSGMISASVASRLEKASIKIYKKPEMLSELLRLLASFA